MKTYMLLILPIVYYCPCKFCVTFHSFLFFLLVPIGLIISATFAILSFAFLSICLNHLICSVCISNCIVSFLNFSNLKSSPSAIAIYTDTYHICRLGFLGLDKIFQLAHSSSYHLLNSVLFCFLLLAHQQIRNIYLDSYKPFKPIIYLLYNILV